VSKDIQLRVMPPALVIPLVYEGRPVIYSDAQSEGDEDRLLHWLIQHPQLLDVVMRARAIRDAAAA
jgi:hypothetical protein